MQFPVFLSAAILNGPNSPLISVLSPQEFIRLCSLHFPHSTLSLGWSSGVGDEQQYSWTHVKQMFDVVHGISQPLNFNVQAEFLVNSLSQVKWLLEMTGASLSVYHHVRNTALMKQTQVILKQLPKHRVYCISTPPCFEKSHQEDTGPDFMKTSAQDTFPLKANLWQIHATSADLSMLLSSESFIMGHGILKTIQEYGKDAPWVIQTRVEFIPGGGGDSLGSLQIFLHGYLTGPLVHGVCCSISKDGTMQLSLKGVSPLQISPMRSTLRGRSPCFQLTIMETPNRQVTFRADQPKVCSNYDVIEHSKQLMIPTVGMHFQSHHLILSKGQDLSLAVVDAMQMLFWTSCQNLILPCWYMQTPNAVFIDLLWVTSRRCMNVSSCVECVICDAKGIWVFMTGVLLCMVTCVNRGI